MLSPTLLLFIGALGAFDPAPALRALEHSEGRWAAMSQILGLGPVDLQAARDNDRLLEAVARVLDDPILPVSHRIIAARTLARLRGGAETCARQLTRGADTPEGIVVARAAAVTLRQLDTAPARKLLRVGLAHPDPEVRATAAAAGPDVGLVCTVLQSDRWPQVRARAAEGLAMADAQSEAPACLVKALSDGAPTVQRAAAASLVRLAPTAAKQPLLTLAANPKGDLAARSEALAALGALGVLDPAKQVLETHLSKGGIEPLALGATRGLALSDSDEALPLLRAALSSGHPPVWRMAAEALVARKDPETLPLLKAKLSKATARERAVLQPLVQLLETVDTPPEDEALEDEDL
ncbi:MAG: HEAT repeat domain-containing protein [Bradymonadia bacterium]